MFVAKVFGQLRFQRGLQDALRELAEQASRPSQAHSLFLRLREQPRGKFLLTDNLPGHGTNHRLVQQLGRVNPAISLRIRPDPHTPFFRQSQIWAGDESLGLGNGENVHVVDAVTGQPWRASSFKR